MLLLVASFADEKVDLTQYKNSEGLNCKQDTPTLTIGDEFVGYRDNLMAYQERFGTFILSVSRNDCNECCIGEIILRQIMQLFEKGDLQYNGKSIPIVRLDIAKHYDMLQLAEVHLDSIPRHFLFHEGKYYLYDEEDHLNAFIAFINRVLYPVPELKTEQQIRNFIDASSEVIESTPFYKEKYRSVKDRFSNREKTNRLLAFVKE